MILRRKPGRVYRRFGPMRVYTFRRGLGVHVEIETARLGFYWRVRE